MALNGCSAMLYLSSDTGTKPCYAGAVGRASRGLLDSLLCFWDDEVIELWADRLENTQVQSVKAAKSLLTRCVGVQGDTADRRVLKA